MPDLKDAFETREDTLEGIECEYLLSQLFPCVGFSDEALISGNMKIINQSKHCTLRWCL